MVATTAVVVGVVVKVVETAMDWRLTIRGFGSGGR